MVEEAKGGELEGDRVGETGSVKSVGNKMG
jgi:hypothetical protein